MYLWHLYAKTKPPAVTFLDELYVEKRGGRWEREDGLAAITLDTQIGGWVLQKPEEPGWMYVLAERAKTAIAAIVGAVSPMAENLAR